METSPAVAQDLPVPVDDGAASHLPGLELPRLRFRSTDGGDLSLPELGDGGLVLYIFPAMAKPGLPDPPGWMKIPGAYGCTQQSCSYRDRDYEFLRLGYGVAGLSAQTTGKQLEAVARLQLPYPLLADPELRLRRTIGLPTFEAGGRRFYKRLTLIAEKGRIVKVFYPVFPPEGDADAVLGWVQNR